MHCSGVSNSVHYLDDFLFWGPARSSACGEALTVATSLFARLGLPTAPSKTVGPVTCLTFLGIEIDSCSQQLRLPAAKLNRLRATLGQWSRKRSASKHELQVLLGLLGHAATVVRPGRTFTRQLIELSKRPRRPSHKVRLNVECRADLAWWESDFLVDWNGVSLFPGLPAGPIVVSDASGSWGCGAYCEPSVSWFQLKWYPSWKSVNIAAKELVPIVISAAIWGSSWCGKSIHFFSDNQAVVTCLTKRSARDPCLAHLLMCLFFFRGSLRV